MVKQLSTIDPQVAQLIKQEETRQVNTINLIASENYTHPAIRQATGSVLAHKYAEGYPGKRYYAGCKYVDAIETLAIERCKKLFGVDHVNVQPHAGSQANMAVYAALLNHGDTIMGMSLASGGHLTHGHALNFSGSTYHATTYDVDPKTGCIDYGKLEQLVAFYKPKMLIAGASAYARTIDFERMGKIAKKYNAFLLADIAHIAGLIAAGQHPSPAAHADCITSTTHKTLRGPRGGVIMCKQAYAKQIDRAIMPGTQGGPFMHEIAAKAVAFALAATQEFVTYQKRVCANAKAMANAFIARGYTIVSGNTDTHLFIVDLRNKNISGLYAQQLFERAGIVASKSCIPFDPTKPWVTSGIRIGTPAITSRGFNQTACREIVAFIDVLIQNHTDEKKVKAITLDLQHLQKQQTALYNVRHEY